MGKLSKKDIVGLHIAARFGHNAALMTAINVASFIPIRKFFAIANKFIADMKDSPRAAGSVEIIVPGEPEFEQKEKRLKDGIFIEENTWATIKKTAEDLKVPISQLSPQGCS